MTTTITAAAAAATMSERGKVGETRRPQMVRRKHETRRGRRVTRRRP
jgi:hypothetical protein